MVKISVIIPVYNSVKKIRKCLDSVINQTLDDIEIIAVNDGSTDNSLLILNEYKEKYSDKVKVIDGTNNGAGGARNRGLEIATGEFISFVDSDDYIEKDMLEYLYINALNNDAEIARCCNKTIFGPFDFGDMNSNGFKCENGTVINPLETKKYVFKEAVSPCNRIAKRELYEGIKFPEKTKWEDIAVVRPLLARSKKIVHLNEQKYIYKANIFGTTLTDFVKPTEKILDIFKSCDCMEKNFKNIGLFLEFKEDIRIMEIFSSMLRVQNAGLWFKMSKNKRIELTNLLVNLIELKYGDWENNSSYNAYKEADPFFKFTMNYIEEKVLDSRLRKETSEQNITKKVKTLFDNK